MFVWVIKILQHNRIDVSEEIDTNKTSASKECMLCHYWCFKYEPKVWCHDVLMTTYELKNIAILDVKVVDNRCILLGVSRNEAFNILNNSKLDDKGML